MSKEKVNDELNEEMNENINSENVEREENQSGNIEVKSEVEEK